MSENRHGIRKLEDNTPIMTEYRPNNDKKHFSSGKNTQRKYPSQRRKDNTPHKPKVVDMFAENVGQSVTIFEKSGHELTGMLTQYEKGVFKLENAVLSRIINGNVVSISVTEIKLDRTSIQHLYNTKDATVIGG